MLRFSNGVNIDTSGELRVFRLKDGWYVVGRGMCIPVDSKEEGLRTITAMNTQDKK